MPHSARPKQSPSDGSILLIEEYDALSAALISALKKFAPRHAVSVARSFAEAEKAIKKACPELVIIDFDPPAEGATDFLARTRTACPNSRGIVIGGGVSAQLASDYRRFGAIHFISKPFEITDFGAAVQALLGPTTHPRATLESLGAADLTLVHCAGETSTLLQVKGNGSKAGEIHILDGAIIHAKTARRKDAAALEEIFGWAEVRVEQRERQRSVKRTIRDDWEEIFLDAVAEAKPRPSLRARVSATPPADEPPDVTSKPPAKPAKTIVIVDDTEMLLVFVEDTLTMADAQFRITTAPTGTAGVKEIETVLPDLVLLDYSLPDINGDEVCRRLLANERTANIPIVMMSGHVPEMTAAAETFPNIVATIAKPFMSEALATLVQQTLEKGLRPAPKPPNAKVVSSARIVSQPTPTPPPKKPAAQKIESVPPRPPPHPAATPAPVVHRPAPAAAPMPVAEVVNQTAEPPLLPPRPAPPVPVPIQAPPPPVQQRPTGPMEPHAQLRGTISAPVLSPVGNEVVLGLFLEVVSMQLTPSLRMGAIRARPSSFTVSLHVSPAALRGLPVETGFELGRVQLDAGNRITTVRLIPTLQAFQRMQTRSAVQVGGLNVVPHDSRDHVQLTPSPSAPMTMHLLAHLELAGVELSTNFQIAQLILKNRSNTVRVTLSSEAVGQEQTGVFCETAAVRVDQSGRIAEMLLKPLK